MHKLRGEVLSLVLVGGLIIASLASAVAISFFQSQKISYKSEAFDPDALCNECYPANQQGGCATGYTCKTVTSTTCGGLKYYCAKDTTTSTPPTKTPNTTTKEKCPANVGTYAGSSLCNQQCSQTCKSCLINTTTKYYCPTSVNSSLPNCTTPNAFSQATCEQNCGGANSCERCQIPGGSQKYHCKTNINTQNLKICAGGSYNKKSDCDPHCVTQCRECKINTTIKYECPSEFNKIPSCTQSRTYGSEASCKAPGECTGSCTLCETAPGTSRYECNGGGPTVPLTQTPVKLGDCSISSSLVSGGVIRNGQSVCSNSGVSVYTCSNGSYTTTDCGSLGCTGGKCNTPTPTPTKTPAVGGSGQCTYTGGNGCAWLNRYSAANCNPSCSYPFSCCGDVLPTSTKVCTSGQQKCALGKIQVCKSDGTGWLEQPCASGTCANATTCLAKFDPNATNCQYSCRKYSCGSNEVQIAQACSITDSVCCKPNSPTPGLGDFGKTCVLDTDCGDPKTMECKFDSANNKRYCAQRTVPLDTSKDTQCTSLNIGFSCHYSSSGTVYYGQCQCAGNSCSCKASTGSPVAPTTQLVETASPEYLRCMRECIGNCITDPQGYVKCVPYSTLQTPVPSGVSITPSALGCGGLFQSCCQTAGYLHTITSIGSCNNNLHCSSNICLPDEEYEENLAVAKELNNYLDNYVSQDPQCKQTSDCSNFGLIQVETCTPRCENSAKCCGPDTSNLSNTINNYIETNVGTNPLVQEQFKEQLSNSCTEASGEPCTGTCVFSNIQLKFVCMDESQIENQFEEIKEEDAKSVGDSCVPVFSTCRSEMLECVNFKCQIKEDSKQFLGYGAAENNATGGIHAPTPQVVNTTNDTPDLLQTFGTSTTQELAENKELSYGVCSSPDQTGKYSLNNGKCWVCIDPAYNSMNEVPLEYCSNEQLQKEGAAFGLNCKAGGNYCAKSSSGCTNTGQSDCPKNYVCCDHYATSTNPMKTGNVGDSCGSFSTASVGDEYGAMDDSCKPGLKCYQGACRDEISLAYDNNYSSGTGNTNNLGGLMDMIINPMIRSISPDYYSAGQTRAEVTQSTMDQCYANAQATGTDSSICDSLYGTVDQLAQTNMTQNKLEEMNPDGLTAAETAYNVIMDIGKFASAYSGESQTVSTLTYAKKSAEANADPNANALDYLAAAAQPGLEIGLTVADVATLGLGDSVFTAASKALQNAAIEVSQGAIKTGVKEVVQETAEQATKEVVQQITEEAAQKAAMEAAQKIAAKTTQETAQQILKEAVQQTADEAAQKITQEATQALVAETTQQAALEAAQAVTRELAQQTNKQLTSKAIEQVAKEAAQTVLEEATPRIANQITGEAAQNVAREIVQETTEKAAKEAAQAAATEVGQKTVQEIATEAADKVTQEAIQEINIKITKETTQEAAEKVATEVGEEFSQKITKEMVPGAIKQTIEEATQATAKQVANELVETTTTEVVSDGRMTLAKGLQTVSTVLNTGKMAEKLLEVPVIGQALGFTEKAVGTAIAAPIMAGAGGLGLLKRGIQSSILPDLIQRIIPNFGQSKLEKAVNSGIAEIAERLLKESPSLSSAELYQQIEKELLQKEGDKASQATLDEITAVVQRRATAEMKAGPIASTIDPVRIWRDLQSALTRESNLDKAIFDIAQKQATETGENIYQLIPQIKAVAEAQQLANRFGVELKTTKQVQNFMDNYNKLLTKQAQGQVTTPKEFVTGLVQGGMDFTTANKLAANMINADTPLLMTAKQIQEKALIEFNETLTQIHKAEQKQFDLTTKLAEAQEAYNKLLDDPNSTSEQLKQAAQDLEQLRTELATVHQQLDKLRTSFIEDAAALPKSKINHEELVRTQQKLQKAETDYIAAQKELQAAKLETTLAQEDVTKLNKELELAHDYEKVKANDAETIKKYGRNRKEALRKIEKQNQELLGAKKPKAPRKPKQIGLDLEIAKGKLDTAKLKLAEAKSAMNKANTALKTAQEAFSQQVANVTQKPNLWTSAINTWQAIKDKIHLPQLPNIRIKLPNIIPPKYTSVDQAVHDVLSGKISLDNPNLDSILKKAGLSDEDIIRLKDRFERIEVGRAHNPDDIFSNSYISRNHGEFIIDKNTGDIYYIDKASTHGTTMLHDGKFVPLTEITPLKSGDIIRMGDSENYILKQADNGRYYLINERTGKFQKLGSESRQALTHEDQFVRNALSELQKELDKIHDPSLKIDRLTVDEIQTKIDEVINQYKRQILLGNRYSMVGTTDYYIPKVGDSEGMDAFKKKLVDINACITNPKMCNTGLYHNLNDRSQALFGKGLSQLSEAEKIYLAARSLAVQNLIDDRVWKAVERRASTILDTLNQLAKTLNRSFTDLEYSILAGYPTTHETQFALGKTSDWYGLNYAIDDIQINFEILSDLSLVDQLGIVIHEILHSFQRAFNNGMPTHDVYHPNTTFVEVFTEWYAITLTGSSNYTGYSKGVTALNSLLRKHPDLTDAAIQTAITGNMQIINIQMIQRGYGTLLDYLRGFSDFDYYYNHRLN